MSRRTALAGTTLGVMGYVLMAGGNPAVVRAAVMGILAFGAQAFGKEYLSWWGLVAAASLMVLLDPEIVFSVSFQLSLAATAGIVWGVKPIERVLKWVIRNWGERWGNMQAGILTLILTDLSTTLAATLSTLPITLIVFNRVSVISPLVNVMLLWIVPPIMALGGVMVGLGMLSLWATGVVSWLVWPLLEVFIAVVEGFARLPWASIEIRGFSWWWGLGWWLVLASWWMTKEPKARRNSSRQEGTGKLKMLQEQHY
jgi:competence protein ComEC